MLERLYIRQIALIKEAEINFSAGMSAVTGETGAGKSMLMDSLGLCLGERADNSIIRTGADTATVEASFIIPKNAVALRFALEEDGVPMDDEELIIRRIISKNGKSRVLVNGARLTLQQLKAIGERLADIHGQQEHQLLLRAARHAELLDRFGNLKKEREQVRSSWQKWHKIRDKLDTAIARVADQEREESLLSAFVAELENLNYNVGEEISLTAEKTRLMGSEKTIEALQSASQAFGGDSNLLDPILKAEKALSAVTSTAGADVVSLAERLEGLVVEINDVMADVESLAGNTKPDPEMLMQVDNRLAALRDTARKHKVEIKDLIEVKENLEQDLEDLSLLQDGLEDLEQREKQAWKIYEESAKILSTGRRNISNKLVKAVEKMLQKLAMKDTKFYVQFDALTPDKWGPGGTEKVYFTISTNIGSKPQPLEKVASGGEVSRLMLALKSVFFAAMPSMTLVFDEIDTGTGGAVADSVGEVMLDLAKHHQVLAITHLPQVAAKGNTHIKIEKMTDGKATRTMITTLDDHKRKEELARMLSGKIVTKAAKEAANSLLKGVA